MSVQLLLGPLCCRIARRPVFEADWGRQFGVALQVNVGAAVFCLGGWWGSL